MKRYIACIFLLLVSFFILSRKGYAKLKSDQSLNSGWTFIYHDNHYPAAVPGCIHTDLFSNKLIPDPFFENNDSLLQWIGLEDWSYENIFNIDSAIWKKEVIEIDFKGLDTYADVYLNDSLIIQADNMFREWNISCKNLLLRQNNRLKIIFQSAEKISSMRYKANGYKFPGEERVMTRKAQFQFGWDFGPRFLTCGIWKNVTLKGWDDFSLTAVNIKLDTLTDLIAALTATLDMQSNSTSEIFIRVQDQKKNANLLLYETKIVTGENEIPVNFRIKGPKRWWCNGYGMPYLYDLLFEVSSDKKNWKSIELSYGLKTIELVNDSDRAGVGFYFKLNGVPVFMKGANYVPMNIFPGKTNSSAYDSLLNDAVVSHFNMLRVWGGGIYEDEEFYNLCDRKGILIWQDFMFACGMYPFDSLFLNNVKSEAVEQVKRLTNHTSLALFCGNNEISEGWNRWGWQDEYNPEERIVIWNGYNKIFKEILPEAVKKYSTLSYWESSPSFGRGDKKHTTEGDAHNWFVWHDGEPFENYEEKIPRFMSEFGFQSYPDKNTIKLFTSKADDIFDQSIQTHQKNKRGNEIIRKYMADEYGIPKTNEDFIYYSQLLQANGIRKGIEAHRRSKPYCMGSLYWQFNDCWPAISWSSRDHTGSWKALQYFAKKAFDTFIISVHEEADTISIYVVNDSLNSIPGIMKIDLMDFTGRKILHKELPVIINANKVLIQKFSKAVLGLQKDGNIDKIIYCRFYVNETARAEKLFYFGKTFDLPLKDPQIKIIKEKTQTGIKLTLTSAYLAKNVCLTTAAGGYFSDNFFDMLPGLPYVIHLKNISHKGVPEIKIKTIFETR